MQKATDENKTLLRKLKIHKSLKTEERLQFEAEYSPHLLILDDDNMVEVEVDGETLYKKVIGIDSICRINNKQDSLDYLNEFSSIVNGMSLRARFNNQRKLRLVCIWFPDDMSEDFVENPESYIELIKKYSFNV